jgi:hypothetical protein
VDGRTANDHGRGGRGKDHCRGDDGDAIRC